MQLLLEGFIQRILKEKYGSIDEVDLLFNLFEFIYFIM